MDLRDVREQHIAIHGHDGTVRLSVNQISWKRGTAKGMPNLRLVAHVVSSESRISRSWISKRRPWCWRCCLREPLRCRHCCCVMACLCLCNFWGALYS